MSSDVGFKRKESVLERLRKQDCEVGWPAYFLVVKASTGEDSWTPNANGMIDLDEEAMRDVFDHIVVRRASGVARCAYVAAEAGNTELFRNMFPRASKQGELLPSQLALSVGDSDIVTAVHLYIQWKLRLLPSQYMRLLQKVGCTIRTLR